MVINFIAISFTRTIFLEQGQRQRPFTSERERITTYSSFQATSLPNCNDILPAKEVQQQDIGSE